MENKIKNSTFVTVIIIAVATFTGISHNSIYGQSVPPMNNTMQQHANHIFDNLIISQHIPLTGNLVNGDYILLMDLTPFATSVQGHSHIAMKIPCDKDGIPKATIVTGIAPNLKSLDVVNTSNETLNFDRGGFSVTVSVHGTAIQHLGNETMSMH